MLVLPFHRHGDLLAVDDSEDPQHRYVTLARPVVAQRPDGRPRFRLIRWVAPPGTDAADLAPVGGRLSLDLRSQPTAGEIEGAGLDPETTRPMPWIDATVSIDGPGFDPVDFDVSLAGGAVAAIDVDLEPAAAGLLAPLIGGTTVSPLQINWTGHIRVRLPATEVLATVDVDEVRRRVRVAAGGRESIITRSIIDANARIKIQGSGNTELEDALREWVLDELSARFAAGEDLLVRATASDVVRWPVSLSTTLDEFVPPQQRPGLVEEIFLQPDEVGVVPAIEVRVLGDFDGALERVDVQLQPASGGSTKNLSLTDERPQAVALGTPSFHWRRRLKLEAAPAGEWSEWRAVERSFGLLLPAPAPVPRAVEVVAAGIDFEARWASIRVVLRQSGGGAAADEHVIELDADRRGATWSEAGHGEPLTARITYVSRQGLVVETTDAVVTSDQVIVTDPFESHRVRRALVPAGSGWRDVTLAMVDVRYRDEAYTYEESIELRSLEDFAEWEVPARPDGPQEVEWRVHASFADGKFEESSWQSSEATAIIIRLDGEPGREVQFLPVFFDAATTTSLTVEIHSAGASETVVITDRVPQTVTLPLGPFRWKVLWSLADGSTTATDEHESDDDVVVLPRLPS